MVKKQTYKQEGGTYHEKSFFIIPLVLFIAISLSLYSFAAGGKDENPEKGAPTGTFYYADHTAAHFSIDDQQHLILSASTNAYYRVYYDMNTYDEFYDRTSHTCLGMLFWDNQHGYVSVDIYSQPIHDDCTGFTVINVDVSEIYTSIIDVNSHGSNDINSDGIACKMFDLT